MKPSLAWLRLRAVWILILPFMWWAAPTPRLLAIGGGIVAAGLAVRSWAAGLIQKNRVLSMRGPYAHTRNPLYLGSLLVGIGVAVAGGLWVFVALYVLFFVGIYGRTIRREAERLEQIFGDAYRAYAEAVPLVLPRLRPYRSAGPTPASFSVRRWSQNREWEALLGALAGFAFLIGKMLWV